MRLFDNAHYNFLRYRRLAVGATLAFVVIGLLVTVIRGVNESIEFTGGTLVQISARSPSMDIGAIRSALASAGLGDAQINTFGSPTEFVVRARVADSAGASSTQGTAEAVRTALSDAFGDSSFVSSRGEAISAKVGSELRSKALFAILLSFGATLLYVTMRFEWRFGIAAIIATAHDIAATVAFIGLTHLEISLVVVAAVLTIVGYSLNDTIIVFDRVRENLRKYKRNQLFELLNLSVNETLPRTILTAGTTLVAVLALLIFGGQVIRGFAIVMTFGIAVGTFSSIYIASPMLLLVERRWPGEDVRGARTLVAEQPQPEAH